MKKLFTSLLVAALAVFVGCNGKGTPGGPGASNATPKGPIVGQSDDTFTLSMPGSTSIKQGETKAATIAIKRGKNFGEDVTLKFADMPKGLTIDPANPVIKHGDTEAKLTFKAADDAALGDFTVKVTGHPSKGSDASNELKITVDKK
jgi:hypothetical protein